MCLSQGVSGNRRPVLKNPFDSTEEREERGQYTPGKRMEAVVSLIMLWLALTMADRGCIFEARRSVAFFTSRAILVFESLTCFWAEEEKDRGVAAAGRREKGSREFLFRHWRRTRREEEGEDEEDRMAREPPWRMAEGVAMFVCFEASGLPRSWARRLLPGQP